MGAVLDRMERQATLLGERDHDLAADLEDMRRLQARDWPRVQRRVQESGDPRAADDIFFRDMRQPHMAADQAPVTLATTDKAIYTPSAFPVLGGQYFARVGKKISIRIFGKITTAVTPGNGTFTVYYGTGADANGVPLAASTPLTLIASRTADTFMVEVWVSCRSTGSTGTLFCNGTVDFVPTVNATGGGLIPATTPVVSAACDLTQALIISVQFKRSGSTVETMTVQDLEVEALN